MLLTAQKSEDDKTSKVDELLYEIQDYTVKGTELLSKGKLTRNMANRFLDSVYVYDIDRIEENLKFQSIIDEAVRVAEQY